MIKQKRSPPNLKYWMEMLSSEDGMTRLKARDSLVAMGSPAVIPLTQALRNSRSGQVRWEAVTALGEIVDARSIPVLVAALEDGSADVAWIAAEALIGLEEAAWQPLLRVLIKRGADSVVLCQGAHHVLANQKRDGFNELLTTLTTALESNTAAESMVVAAYELLQRVNDESSFTHQLTGRSRSQRRLKMSKTMKGPRLATKTLSMEYNSLESQASKI